MCFVTVGFGSILKSVVTPQVRGMVEVGLPSMVEIGVDGKCSFLCSYGSNMIYLYTPL